MKKEQINEGIVLYVDKQRSFLSLEIEGKDYDIFEKIGNEPSGICGFPIKLKGHDFGMILLKDGMENTYDINNLVMCIHDYTESQGNPGMNIDYSDIKIRDLFDNFVGEYKEEKCLGYGNQYIRLINKRI